jgi:hypothetical protein
VWSLRRGDGLQSTSWCANICAIIEKTCKYDCLGKMFSTKAVLYIYALDLRTVSSLRQRGHPRGCTLAPSHHIGGAANHGGAILWRHILRSLLNLRLLTLYCATHSRRVWTSVQDHEPRMVLTVSPVHYRLPLSDKKILVAGLDSLWSSPIHSSVLNPL